MEIEVRQILKRLYFSFANLFKLISTCAERQAFQAEIKPHLLHIQYLHSLSKKSKKYKKRQKNDILKIITEKFI